jgi:hypothetical protein
VYVGKTAVADSSLVYVGKAAVADNNLVYVGKAAIADNSQVQADSVLSIELGAAQPVYYALHCPLTSKRFLLLTIV